MRHNQFSEAEIVAGIIEWAEIESPSIEPPAVAAMVRHVRARLDAIGCSTATTSLSEAYGPVLKATLPGEQEGPGILILGHLDTVHPTGTKSGPLPIRIEGDRLYGPGVLDMKGGMFLAYYALKALAAAGERPRLPVTFLCIPEEELGSPASRALIEAEAKRHRHVLVPEPARGGKAITGRHAFVRYELITRGRPAHAGADNPVGRSAIRAMARLVERIESRTDMDRLVSFSVGVIAGGRFVNVVPIECRAEVLAVASSEENLRFVREFMSGLKSPMEGVELEVVKGAERPLFKPQAATMALYTHGEHLLISSLVPRARLLAGLIAELD